MCTTSLLQPSCIVLFKAAFISMEPIPLMRNEGRTYTPENEASPLSGHGVTPVTPTILLRTLATSHEVCLIESANSFRSICFPPFCSTHQSQYGCNPSTKTCDASSISSSESSTRATFRFSCFSSGIFMGSHAIRSILLMGLKPNRR